MYTNCRGRGDTLLKLVEELAVGKSQVWGAEQRAGLDAASDPPLFKAVFSVLGAQLPPELVTGLVAEPYPASTDAWPLPGCGVTSEAIFDALGTRADYVPRPNPRPHVTLPLPNHAPLHWKSELCYLLGVHSTTARVWFRPRCSTTAVVQWWGCQRTPTPPESPPPLTHNTRANPAPV